MYVYNKYIHIYDLYDMYIYLYIDANVRGKLIFSIPCD